MIQGPRCTGIATTVDHIIPTSQGGAFWDTANLRASCERCNYGRGSSIAADTRQATVELQAVIDPRRRRSTECASSLRKHEKLDTRPRAPAQPAIY
jgi:5-methylcytosine-specific restriction endonuclease McrA